jgi:glycosyltransferase involved in cell wall biosynthesis
MTARRFDQLLDGYTGGDAISHEARTLAGLARQAGWQARLFAPREHIAPALRDDCLPLEACDGGSDDCLLYHCASVSPAAGRFRAAAGCRLLRYHNITPSAFFRPYDRQAADGLDAARAALPALVAAAHMVWADSAYNAAELAAWGAAKTQVAPLFVPLAAESVVPDATLTAQLGGGFVNWLFVGRLAPNKSVEDLLLAFAWYQRRLQGRSRLIVAGSDRTCPRYAARLRFLAGQMGLANVMFAGFVSEAQLAACYRQAALYVCASRHEGFCLPLLDAMAHGVPVIARGSGGVAEAMGAAGVRYEDVTARELALLAQRLEVDTALRGEVLAAQAARVAAWRARDLAAEWAALMARADAHR